jgi:hypothetical protein
MEKSGNNGRAGHFKSSAAVGEAKTAKPLLYVCPLTHRSRGCSANGRARRPPLISPSVLQATMASHHVHAPCTMQHGFPQPWCSCRHRSETTLSVLYASRHGALRSALTHTRNPPGRHAARGRPDARRDTCRNQASTLL